VSPLDVYLEVGTKRTFAGAVQWPGWCRAGRDEDVALEALLDYRPRYAAALAGSRLRFPKAAPDLRVVERVTGGATTDFGAPGASPSADLRPVNAADLRRLGSVLAGCWRTFDRAVEAARGRELARGPRGGGRSLDKIVAHVDDADHAYLRSVGWTAAPGDLEHTRAAILEAAAAAARGEIEPVGPRGGRRWVPRYFVRRVAWHVLDHSWEIEDRMR
jgi:hypothetical protein